MIRTGDLIVQRSCPKDEKPWYVHEISLLDMGRFRTMEEAMEHRDFLVEKYKELNTS